VQKLSKKKVHKWPKNAAKIVKKNTKSFLYSRNSNHVKLKKRDGVKTLPCRPTIIPVQERRCPDSKAEAGAKSSFCVSVNTVTWPF
jgi:hypothetical protein